MPVFNIEPTATRDLYENIIENHVFFRMETHNAHRG